MTHRCITYSPAYTLVPTYECFNRCTYCNFRTDPQPNQPQWLTLAAARSQLLPLLDQGIIEVLVLSGEVHPHSPQRSAWLERIYAICQLALELGFLPHTNVGPLSRAEMQQLKTVNVSMGLMLEQLTPTLLTSVHRHAPSKDPQLRLQQLEMAGELQIPFTTGLLLGIGETAADRRETLVAIATLHQTYGHIQEVILQPHRPGHRQAQWQDSCTVQDLIDWIAIARAILPAEITLQIPPNLLTDTDLLLTAVAAGAGDLGGIGPKDEVNPDYPHCHLQALDQHLQQGGWQLVPRLPVYPQYDHWLSPTLRSQVSQYRHQLSILEAGELFSPNPSQCDRKGQ